MTPQILQLTLQNVSLEDARMVSLVKLLRSVPSLMFDSVNIEPKHWEAIASGLNDSGIRVRKINLNNFSTSDDSIAHIIKALLSIVSVELWRMEMSSNHWSLLATALKEKDHKTEHLALCNIFIDDENVSQYCSCVSQVRSVWLSSLGKCGTYTTYTAFPDMKGNVWDCLSEELSKEDKTIEKLKLTMVDNVSFTRNIGAASLCIRSVETVIIHDVCMGREEWSRLGQELASREKKLRRLELFQILGVDQDNIADIAKCISFVQEVRLSSFCSMADFWGGLRKAFQEPEIQLKLLELVSISVDEASVADFASCVAAIPEVKMEKVKLRDNWPSFLEHLSVLDTAVCKLYLTECWPGDLVVEKIKSLDHFKMEQDQEDGEFTLNNNTIVLTKI